MNYFNAADLVQHDATVNYIAKSGIAFGIMPNNEQVFFSARYVNDFNLNIGDAVRVWAVDNFASPDTAHFPSRWRAVRLQVLFRVENIISAPPNVVAKTPTPVAAPTPPVPVVPPKPAMSVDLVGSMDKLLAERRPWSVNEMAHTVAKASTPLSAQPDLLQRVGTRLAALHKAGDVACLKIYSKADNDRASAVYYAKDVDVFYDYLDTPLNDEDEE